MGDKANIPLIVGLTIGGILLAAAAAIVIVALVMVKPPEAEYKYAEPVPPVQISNTAPNFQFTMRINNHIDINNENIVGVRVDRIDLETYWRDNRTDPAVDHFLGYVKKEDALVVPGSLLTSIVIPYDLDLRSATLVPNIVGYIKVNPGRDDFLLWINGTATVLGDVEIPLSIETLVNV